MITVKQVDRRTLTVGFPASPEEVARALYEADSDGFTLTGAEVDGTNGTLDLALTRNTEAGVTE